MDDTLFYETAGDRRHPHLVMLHGFLSSNLQWTPNRAGLQAALHLVMTELWGHGRSPCPSATPAYDARAYVAHLDRIRETLGIERWCVLGQSFGAGLAVRYALEKPQHTSGVIITNSRSMFGSIPAGVPREVYEEQFRNRRRLAMHPVHARLLPKDLKARLVEAADRVDHTGAVLGMLAGHTLTCANELAALEVPLMIVNGQREMSFQRDLATLGSVDLDFEVVDIDAGHAVNLEQPQAFNAAVIAFCRRHGNGAKDSA